ncbi:MAG: PQQ-binding-like beta-propeller repeat protein [Candidatus Firestonebacteria bacterium]
MNKKILNDILRLTLKQAAAASAVISIFAVAVLAYVYFSGTTENIKDSAALASFKQEIEKYPDDKKLVERFREVDFQERSRFFGKTELLEAGTYLSLGFLILALLCFRGYALLTERIPEVKKGSALDYDSVGKLGKDLSLFSSSLTALLIVVFFLALFSLMGLGRFPWQAKEVMKEKTKIKIEFADQWPGFRGFGGQGVVSGVKNSMNWIRSSTRPTSWSYSDLLSWKMDLPVKAYSSPIVFEDNLFLTGSEGKKLKVLSFSASKGSLNWSSTVLVKTNIGEIEVMSEEAGGAGYASPTPVTDGEYVYAYFATNQLVCFDFNGKQKWMKFFGQPENTYGLSSSPVLFEDKILLQVDQSGEGASKLYAVNKSTGEIVWETKRPEGPSWGTPIIIDYKGRKELITTGNSWVISYEPATGKELWRVDCLSGDVSTSPAYADGKVYALSVGSQTTVFALTPGGEGDVTKTNIVWQHEEESQSINAPVAVRSKLIVAMNGLVVCHETETGKILWQYKLEDDFWAAPVAADDLVFIPSQKGKVYIFDLDGKLVNTIDIGEKLSASMALYGGSIYIRTDKSLLCLGKESSK